MNKYKYLAKNTFLFTIGSLSSKLVMFIFLPLYTYYLTTEQYATIDLITVINKLLVPVLSCSIYEGVLRFALDKNEDKKKVFTIGLEFLILGCIIALLLLPMLDLVESLGEYKIYCYLLFVITALNSLFSVFARSIDKVKIITINSIVSTSIIAILNVLLIAVLKMNIHGYFISLIVGNFVSNILYFIVGKMYIYVDFKSNDKVLLKKMLKYSIPLIPNSLFWWINSSIDRFFLTAMSTLSIVGLYSAASKLPAILNTLNGIFQQAWGISAIKENEEHSDSKFFSQVYILYNLFILICSIGIIITCKYFGKILFNKDFYEAWKIVPALTVGFFYSCLNSFLGTIYTSNKKTGSLLTTTCIGALINITFNFIFIPKLGAIGAAIGTCISHFCVWIFRFVNGNKILRLDVNIKNMIFSHIGLIIIALLITMNKIYFEILSIIIIIVIMLVNKRDILIIIKKFQETIIKRKGKNDEKYIEKNEINN